MRSTIFYSNYYCSGATTGSVYRHDQARPASIKSHWAYYRWLAWAKNIEVPISLGADSSKMEAISPRYKTALSELREPPHLFLHPTMPETFSHKWDTPVYKGETSFNTGLFINGQYVDGKKGQTIEWVAKRNPVMRTILSLFVQSCQP